MSWFGKVDYFDRNHFLDVYEDIVVVPERDDVQITDPDVYMKRLAEINTPSERLREYFYDLFNIYGATQRETHETRWTRYMFCYGLLGGWFLGGLINSQGLHEDYIRKHNASVFDHKHKGTRHRFDTFALTIAQRGARRGIATALLCGSVGVISFGSISYRNELYYPDWAVGFTILGAASRVWVSPRAIAMGGMLGLMAGTFGYGIARLEEKLSGMSVTQMRYLTHVSFVTRREALMPRLKSVRKKFDKEMMDNLK